MLGNSSPSMSQPIQVASIPIVYEPFGPFDCLKSWRETSLCPYDFLEAVICELDGLNCWFDSATQVSIFQRGIFLVNYWSFITANSDHVFNSATLGANLIYFNSLQFSEQSEIYALTICHINSDACYVNERGGLTIYQPDEEVCEIINGTRWCYKPSDGAICQISPQACGSRPD